MAKVIKFSQEVCPKCDVLERVLGSLEYTVDEVIMLDKDNEEEYNSYLEKYQIMGTPLMVAVDEDGNEIARTSAYNQVGQIIDFFESVQ